MVDPNTDQSRSVGGEVLGDELLEIGRSMTADLVAPRVQSVPKASPVTQSMNNIIIIWITYAHSSASSAGSGRS